MLKVLMLDLGDTLVHANQVYPGVHVALNAFQEMRTANAQPLELCLVSDYHLLDPDAPQDELDGIVEQYVSLLDGFELKSYFEPVDRRVTLSTHAGVYKPDKRVFEKALQRLGTTAEFSECAFITENKEHVQKARDFGIDAFCFDPDGSGDFSNWSQAPLLLARKISDKNPDNLEIALRAYFLATDHTELIDFDLARNDRVRARVKSPTQLSDSRLGDLDGIYVGVPAEASIKLNRVGTIDSIETISPSPTDMQEIVNFVMSLKERGQIGPSESHNIEIDSLGHRRLSRKRFEKFNH